MMNNRLPLPRLRAYITERNRAFFTATLNQPHLFIPAAHQLRRYAQIEETTQNDIAHALSKAQNLRWKKEVSAYEEWLNNDEDE